MEFGREQFGAMCRLFTESGIHTFGHKEKPYIIADSEGQRIGILGFSTVPAFYGFEPEYLFVDPDREDTANALLAWVRQARACCDYLIVYPHWGCEYVPYASASQIALARSLIATGADLVAGAHPHVIQNLSYIDKRPVLFSMGNFASDLWQSRFRESICAQVEVGVETAIRLHKLITGQDYVVRYFGELPSPPASEPTVIPAGVYAKLVNRARSRVRREILLFLARRIGSVLRNPTLLKWIFRRVLFLIKNWRSIKSDPLKVYSQK
jgi:poly-gamma-glutamate synthesis protein (capsule biosynthesis protein)